MSRPSKVWYRRDRDAWGVKRDGKWITLARGKSHKREAVVAFHNLMLQTAASTGHNVGISIGELCDRLLAWVLERRAPLTYEWYKRHLTAFVKYIGSQKAANDLRPFHVLDWFETRMWGQSTRHGALTAVKRAFRWGKRMGHLELDRFAGMDRPGIRRRENILTPEAEQRVLRQGGPLADYLSFMFATGCRASEVARLEWKHVDLEAARVILPGKTTARTGRERVIYLTPEARQLLERLPNREGPIFRNSRGRPWTRNARALAMKRLRLKLGMGPECTASSFRHGWVTDAKLRLPNSVVAELAGHTSTAMVDRHYGHLSERSAELAKAAGQVRK